MFMTTEGATSLVFSHLHSKFGIRPHSLPEKTLQSPVTMAAAVPNSPETSRRMMCVTPPRSSIEMREELTLAPRKNQGKNLRKVLIEDEDIVKQDFTVSCDRVGRFVFDKMF